MTLISFLIKLVMLAGLGNYIENGSKFVIIKSEMSESMKKHALGTAIMAFEEPEIPINSKRSDIANKLSSEFDEQYGKHWFCLVGPPGVVSNFDHIVGTLLWFSYRDIQVIMFKMAKPAQSDVISESRRTDKIKVKVLLSEMPEATKTQAITTAIIAFNEYNTYARIAANITDTFDETHGKQWQCVIGYQSFSARVHYEYGTYLEFEFGDAQVALYQVERQLEPHEVISRARLYLYNPVIDYNTLKKSVRNRLLRVSIENIYRYDNFVDIARGITSSLLERDTVHWACVVGHTLFVGEHLPECDHHALSLNFGELRVLLCAYDIQIVISSSIKPSERR